MTGIFDPEADHAFIRSNSDAVRLFVDLRKLGGEERVRAPEELERYARRLRGPDLLMTDRNVHAGLPITDDDATIARALEDVSIPALMLSMVHMTGDPGILRGSIRPQGIFLNEVQGFMSEKNKAEVRRQALDVIRAYRDGGCNSPPLSPELVHEMMSWLVCAEVPDEYVPMMIEEMELDGRDDRVVSFDGLPEEARADFPVVVIGCGQSGLLAGGDEQESGADEPAACARLSCREGIPVGFHKLQAP